MTWKNDLGEKSKRLALYRKGGDVVMAEDSGGVKVKVGKVLMKVSLETDVRRRESSTSCANFLYTTEML